MLRHGRAALPRKGSVEGRQRERVMAPRNRARCTRGRGWRPDDPGANTADGPGREPGACYPLPFVREQAGRERNLWCEEALTVARWPVRQTPSAGTQATRSWVASGAGSPTPANKPERFPWLLPQEARPAPGPNIRIRTHSVPYRAGHHAHWRSARAARSSREHSTLYWHTASAAPQSGQRASVPCPRRRRSLAWVWGSQLRKSPGSDPRTRSAKAACTGARSAFRTRME